MDKNVGLMAALMEHAKKNKMLPDEEEDPSVEDETEGAPDEGRLSAMEDLMAAFSKKDARAALTAWDALQDLSPVAPEEPEPTEDKG